MNWGDFQRRINLLNKKKAILLIVILSFLLSLGYSLVYKIEPVVDAQAYDRIAVNLVNGFGFREDSQKSFEFDTAIVRAGPAYEFFLAGVYTVFGHHYEIIWVLQALLHALTVYLIYLIGRSVFGEYGETIGLIAAVFFAIHPDLIEISAMLMTETLYLFLITLTIWLFIKLYHEPNKILYSILLALVVGVAILSRPTVIFFIPVILVYYFFNKKYKSIFIFLFCLGLTLLPWIIRNYLIYHQFILTTMIGEYNLWLGNTLISNGGQIASGPNPLMDYTAIHGFFSLKQKASEVFWTFFTTHPFVFIKLCLVRTVRYFSLIRPMGFWFYQIGLSKLIFIVSSGMAIAIIFITGFSGMVLSWREKNFLFYYLFFFAITSPLALLPTVVQSRYRFQIYPFLVLFGAYFLSSLFVKYSCTKKVLLVVTLFLVFISLLDFYMFWSVVWERIKILI